MFRTLIIILLILASICGIAQDSLMQTNVGIRIDRKEQRTIIIQTFADSINSTVDNNLPNFIYDECFDYNNSLLEGFHSNLSSRWKVLEKVTNLFALETILNSNDKSLKAKCSKSFNKEIMEMQFARKSYFQLAKKRLKEIKKK